MNFEIKTVTAFVAIDEKNGDEGVIAQYMGGAWMPFICADETRVQALLPICKDFCEKANKKFRILQFSVREDVTEKYIP